MKQPRFFAVDLAAQDERRVEFVPMPFQELRVPLMNRSQRIADHACRIEHVGGPEDTRRLVGAVGRDYLDAAPVRGVRHGGGGEKMEANVSVAESAQQQQQ